VASVGDWILGVTGEVVAIDRENLDKSGRNPKYMLTFRIKPAEVEVADGATVPDEIPVRVKDLDLARLAKVAPAVGDRVRMTAKASGPRPATFQLKTVERLGH
jgi:hypothetical protein